VNTKTARRAIIDVQRIIGLEKLIIIHNEIKNMATVIKLYFADLENEITALIKAKAKTQLFCLNTKYGIFQNNSTKG